MDQLMKILMASGRVSSGGECNCAACSLLKSAPADQFKKFTEMLPTIVKQVQSHKDHQFFDVPDELIQRVRDTLTGFLNGEQTALNLDGSVFDRFGDLKYALLDVSDVPDNVLIGLKALLSAHDYSVSTVWTVMQSTIETYTKNNWSIDGTECCTGLPIELKPSYKSIWSIKCDQEEAWEDAHQTEEYKFRALLPIARDFLTQINEKYADQIKEHDELSDARFDLCLAEIKVLLNVTGNDQLVSIFNTKGTTTIHFTDKFMMPESNRDRQKLKWLQEAFSKHGVTCEVGLKHPPFLPPSEKPRFQIGFAVSNSKSKNSRTFEGNGFSLTMVKMGGDDSDDDDKKTPDEKVSTATTTANQEEPTDTQSDTQPPTSPDRVSDAIIN